MNELLTDFTIFVLAIFIGYEVISRVPVLLHTPLMSGTNAIHGIVLVGAILVTGTAETTGVRIIGMLGVILGTINVVGGFLVTDRMLLMFSKKPGKPGAKS
jgi:proton-translocating NAD(P)+ transhydrogenase subunit alpha